METKSASSPASPFPPTKPRRTFSHEPAMAEKRAREAAQRALEAALREQREERGECSRSGGGESSDAHAEIAHDGSGGLGIPIEKIVTEFERLSDDVKENQRKIVKRPEGLQAENVEEVVELSAVNGDHSTQKLEDGDVSPLSPCESHGLLKSGDDSVTEPASQLKIKRSNNCIREKRKTSVGKETEGEQERSRRRRNRAVLLRNHTLEVIKKQNEVRPPTTHQMLFTTALIVSIEKPEGKDEKQHPVVSYSFGATSNDVNLASILYPDSAHALALKREKLFDSSLHSFFVVLTDENGIRSYAYCIKFKPRARGEDDEYFFPSVFAVVSSIRDPSFYFELTTRCITLVYDPPRLQGFLTLVHPKEHPRRGVLMMVEEQAESVSLDRKPELCMFGVVDPKMKLGWSVDEAVRQMTPEWTTCLIAAALGQQRIIITGSNVHEVTRAVHAIDALLRPLEWPFCLIPCLPDALSDICDNPSPYLVGLLRHNLGKIQHLVCEEQLSEFDCEKQQSEFALFDIDRGLINPLPLSHKKNRHLEEHNNVFRSEKEREQHARVNNCVTYCKRVGVPSKLSKALLHLLYKALDKERRPFAHVEATSEAMLHWYASLFGHFRGVGILSQWDPTTKAALLEKQTQPARREYLEYLVESAMFTLWIERRAKMSDRRPVYAADDLESVDNAFDKVTEAQAYRRKKPVKHALGKLFGTSKRH